MSDQKDSDDIPRILFEPFETREGEWSDGTAWDVRAKLSLFFGDPLSDGPLVLANKLISGFLNGMNGECEVDGCLTIYHPDEELPPTPFGEGAIPESFRQIVNTYRQKDTHEISGTPCATCGAPPGDVRVFAYDGERIPCDGCIHPSRLLTMSIERILVRAENGSEAVERKKEPLSMLDLTAGWLRREHEKLESKP